MTTKTTKQFLQKVAEDEQLEQEFAQALNSENQQQATFELANKYGYQSSSDELWTEIKNVQSELQSKLDSGEINEEELQAVAGGKDGSRTAAALIAGGTIIAALISKKWDD